ncbi:MAG TPA: D-hexose-6-phosphate mutarotase, partial [Candidatus Saccharimonadales bacterium]|nr:D-hexose-6-phosphate mutarotase [Candidatus Saccharimonadales bacterium]
IPNHVAITSVNGGLPKILVTTASSTTEIYLHGAHVAHFQKKGEPPLLFLSRKSRFALNEPIRGGVPICFPWFGNRDGEPSHGFARITEWQLVKTSATPDGSVTVTFALLKIPGREAWENLRTEFIVTVADKLKMELTTTNDSRGKTVEIENCLHTYFHVGDIGAVSVTGLEGLPFDDFAFGASGARKAADTSALRVSEETNRVYPDHAGAVEIRDESLKRTIQVKKFNSNSTVVWNPWATQKLPDDFDPAEHKTMVCVESGNVKRNKISLAPGKTTSLKVILSSQLL